MRPSITPAHLRVNRNGDRPTCWSCMRPQSHCVCNLVTPFEAHCRIVILQHPHERRKYYSTSKLIAASVRNATIVRGIAFDAKRLSSLFDVNSTYLLYPGENVLPAEEVPLTGSSTIVAIDGTWSEAGKVLRGSPLLQLLPRVSFSDVIESRYRIRKQPSRHCLSTLESLAHLLTINARTFGPEGATSNYEALLNGFDRMVSKQFGYFPRNQPAP